MKAYRRLIIRPGAIGDFILTLPAMECLKAEFLEVWAASPNLPLARFATRIRSIASSRLDMLEFSPNPALIEELRSFNSIVSWYGANRPEFRDRVQELGLPFEFFTAVPPEDSPTHAVDFFIAQVCHGRGAQASPHIDCPPAARGNFAVIHPFSSSPKKCWPLDRYRELAAKVKIPVRWLAGPEEHLPGAVHIDDLYELACWLATARVYIGNDAGITHLAAAVGVPVVALFGPTDPRIWAPRGPQVHVIAKPALDDITVEEVLNVLVELQA